MLGIYTLSVHFLGNLLVLVINFVLDALFLWFFDDFADSLYSKDPLANDSGFGDYFGTSGSRSWQIQGL